MASLWTGITDLWNQGGFVMPWLVGSSIVLWWAIGERIYTLRRAAVVAQAIARVAHLPLADRNERRLREALGELYESLDRHRVLIMSLAATAPLIGLLGTVSGMIETFDSLTTMSMHTGSGGIAGGISEALVSTQMGLSVAIPAMLAGRLLEKTQHRLEDELHGLPELHAVGGT